MAPHITRQKQEDTDMPETWGRLLVKLGAISAIALWLTYQLTGDMKKTIQTAADNAAVTKSLVEEHVKGTAPLQQALQSLVNVQLQNCVNQAGTDVTKRDRCFDAVYNTPTR